MSPDGADKVGRQASAMAWAMGSLTVALLITAGVVGWAELRTDEPFAPLDFRIPQTVTSRTASIDGSPGVHLGETVDVTAEKCSDVAVSIEAVTSWQPVEPRDVPVATGTSSGVRDAGCTVTTYANRIPPEVVAVVTSQHARGIEAPLWVISGAETPTSEDGREGSVEVWVTEPFAILP